MQELLDAAKPAVIKSLQDELAKGITYEAKELVMSEVRDYVKTWTQENVIPEIAKQLIENNESLISLGVTLAPKVVDAVAEAMTEAVAENLRHSWGRKKVFQALFD